MPVRPSIYDIENFKSEQEEAKRIKTTHRESWKRFERTVAKDFGTTRTPLSGSVKTITNSDTLHPFIYVECKYRGDDSFKFIPPLLELDNEKINVIEQISADGEHIYLFKHKDFLKLTKGKILSLEQINNIITYKQYKSILSLYKQTEERAEIENKLPVIALKNKGSNGYLIGLKEKYFKPVQSKLGYG